MGPPPAAEPSAGGTSSPALRVAYALCALGFFGGAVSHVVRGLAAAPDDPQSPTRHLVFVAIDLLAAGGMLWRPRWLVAPFAVLFLHQLTTHGAQAYSALAAGEPPLLVDALVCLFMPVVLVLLIHNATRR